MKKVLFKKWIKGVSQPTDLGHKFIEGTNCWEADFKHEGLFHQWAAAYEESSEGFGNYTVALVEMPNGTIEQVLPSNIKFLN